jgi:hypothetical protein
MLGHTWGDWEMWQDELMISLCLFSSGFLLTKLGLEFLVFSLFTL